MTVADTDVLIDYLNGAEPGLSAVREELRRGSLATTPISRFEILAGARSPKSRMMAHELLRALPSLVLDDEAAYRAAAIRRELAFEGNSIGMANALIAGIVVTHGAALLTRNRQHFERVPGLRFA